MILHASKYNAYCQCDALLSVLNVPWCLSVHISSMQSLGHELHLIRLEPCQVRVYTTHNLFSIC